MGEELIKVLLNDKWLPIIFLFKFLCLAQIITALNAVNNFVHTSQGRPQWRLYFYATLALFMALSFFFAVQKGIISKVDIQEALTPLNLTYVIEQANPDLILLTRTSADFGLGKVPGMDMMVESLKMELSSISKVPLIEVARTLG